MTLAMAGLAVGVVAATLLTSSLTPLFGVSPHDLAAFLPLGALLLIALVACLLPARRTNRLDPVAALRQD